jgi:hypothetical protein
MKRDVPVPYRLPLLAAGFISLAFGIGAGWLRMGVAFPLPSPALAAMHGPLMVCGFLGTVIAMERAVAIGARWAYLGPLLAALGALALFMETATGIGASLMLLASAVLLTASASVFLRQSALYTATLLLGSASWLIGNALWVAGLPFMQLMPWWAGFLILTIAGERLELSRMLPPSRLGQAFFVGIITLLLVGAVAASIELPARLALFSAALVALSLWLFRQDIARRTIRQRGLTRYIAACLLSGYGWLLIAGVIGLSFPMLMPGTSYDAFLHAIFVGFVFSMIFGHAPIIFPAVARIKIPYHPAFYLPLLVLHVSLAARIAGDLLHIPHCRTAGGILNGVALALFVLTMAASVLHGRRQA